MRSVLQPTASVQGRKLRQTLTSLVFRRQLRRLQHDQIGQVLLLQAVDFLVKGINLARPVHGAELGSAHGAECGFFVVVIWKRLVVHGASGFGVKREGKLLFPIEWYSARS